LEKLFGAVHLARAARGENHSGFLASLEKSESSHPERQKETRVPRAVYACIREDGRQHRAYCDHNDAEEQALSDFLRPDIDELRVSAAHEKLPPALFIDFFDLLSGLTRIIFDMGIFSYSALKPPSAAPVA
jgi:hypothetical protein